jgi:hypothetical protein
MRMHSQLLRTQILSAVLSILSLAGMVGCNKSAGTAPRIADNSKIVVEPGRGISNVCEVGMSFAQLETATGDARRLALWGESWWSLRQRQLFILVPSLGATGIPENKNGLTLFTFHVQPYDSSRTCPGLVVDRPFRGSVGSRLSFSNHIVSRKEVETAFGPVTQELTNYADFSGLPDKTQPFSFRGEQLTYARFGLDFYLKTNAVTGFSVYKPYTNQ